MSVYESLDFQPMVLTDLFRLHRGKKPESEPNPTGKTPYIAAASRDNSQVGWVNEKALVPGNWLAIVNTGAGGVGYCTYQPVPFYPSNNVTALEPLYREASPEALLVLAASIRHQAFRFFGYGNIANNRRLSVLKIMTPVVTSSDGTTTPDWAGMTAYGRELLENAAATAESVFCPQIKDDDTLPNLVFQPMLITDVFESIRAAGKWFDLIRAQTEGVARHPYVARSGGKNGISAFLPQQESAPPNAGNCITIGVSTSTVFYQPVDFYTSKEIQVLRSDRINTLNGPVLTAILREQMMKFQWGNGASLARLTATRIMVPATVDNFGESSVDWEGMTQYGQVLRAHAERQVLSVTHNAQQQRV